MVSHATPFQREAIQSQSSFLIIEAGPGAGKTATLSRRYQFLRKWAEPSQILVAAFTREAAKSIRSKVIPFCKDIPPKDQASLPIGTLHSLAARVVTSLRLKAGEKPLKMLPEDVTIGNIHASIAEYAEADSERWNNLRKSLGGNIPVSTIAAKIAILLSSTNIPTYCTPITVRPYVKSDQAADFVSDIVNKWSHNWRAEGIYDHAAIIPLACDMLSEDVGSRTGLQPRHLLLDEVQDYTSQQWRFVDILGRAADSLTIIGDRDQKIFTWRGAVEMPTLVGFPEMYYSRHLLSRPEKVVLDRSFRCPQAVLGPAIRLVNMNHFSEPKNYTSSKNGHLFAAALPIGEQSKGVAKVISSLSASAPENIAVLARRQDLLRPLFFALLERQVPVKYLRAEKDIDANLCNELALWAKLARAPADKKVFAEVILNRLLPGIGPATAAKVMSLDKNGGSCVHILRTAAAKPNIKGLQKRALSKSADQIETLSRSIVTMGLGDWFVELDSTTGILEKHAKLIDVTRHVELKSAWDFYVQAGNACSTPDRFIRAFTQNDNISAVSLATFHSSKGLEWDNVFIYGAGASDLEKAKPYTADPIFAAGVCDGGIEEERRLFHVAMTRTKSFLSVTWEGLPHNGSINVHEAGIEADELSADEYTKIALQLAMPDWELAPVRRDAQLAFF